MCGMPRWSLNVVCPSTVPLNTLATKVEEEVKEVEATCFVPYPEEDQMWITGVPLTSNSAGAVQQSVRTK